MKLATTMLETKIIFAKMKKHLFTNCSNIKAQQDILEDIKAEEKTLNEIDFFVSQGKYKTALTTISSHMHPRKKDWYIKRNYDYDEGWHTILDDFRDGKIENVVDVVRKRRRWPKGKDQNVKDSNEVRIDTSVDNPDKKKKEKVSRAEDSMIPTNTYCDSKKNKKYWKELKKLEDNDYNEAIDDFLKYIEEIKC